MPRRGAANSTRESIKNSRRKNAEAEKQPETEFSWFVPDLKDFVSKAQNCETIEKLRVVSKGTVYDIPRFIQNSVDGRCFVHRIWIRGNGKGRLFYR
jgi:hypothetical protein